MKKIVSSFLIMFCGLHGFSQNDQHNATNANITPFRDAVEYVDGFRFSALRNEATWQHFIKKYPTWGATFDRRTKLPHRAFGSPISFADGGNDVVAKAKAFLMQEFKGFNLPLNEFVLIRNYNDGKYIHVDFKQMHEGKEILWSRITFRFTQDLRIVMLGMDAHRTLPTLNPSLTANLAKSAAEQAIHTPITNSEVDSKLVWFPYPNGNSYDYKQAYVVTVNTQDDKETPGKYVTYVDASNGDILYRQNKVVHVGFTVKADAYPTNLFAPLANLPLKNLQVNVGGTNYYTDLMGLITSPGTTPVNPTITLTGKFIKIVTGQNGTTSASYSTTNVAQGDIVNYPHSNPDATERHMTCYYHANEIHDFMKFRLPSFTAMDNPLTTRVDRTDGNCNAFYDGTSINFYTTSNGCNALSLISDVMYHEYGHGITNEFWADQGINFANGAQGEGYSDIWAVGITKNPIIGPGFNFNQANSFIRRYDINPKVYPTDIVGEVHADGEIIAGAWYDYAINLGGLTNQAAFDTMSILFADTHYGLATGPDGQEGQVYHDILIDALQYDDNDNNLANGTPHFFQIADAFAKHGIYLLSQTEMDHNNNAMVPASVNVPIQAVAHADYPVFLGDVKMFFRKRGTTVLDSLTLTKTSDSIYNGSFTTATIAGDIYEYYFTVYDYANTPSVSSPIEAKFSVSSTQKNLPYYLIFGYKSVFLENFDLLNSSTPDWQIGGVSGDGVTLTSKGKWDVTIPISSRTNGDTVQTGRDHTTGTGKCAVTGNATSVTSQATSADVDAGRTTLITKEFDISTYNKPVISYWRWFSNSQGSNARKDHWRVWASYNNGSTWFALERTYQPDVSWRRNIFVPSTTQGGKVKLMFVAIDTANASTTQGSLVEAAIDDIEILELDNTPAGLPNIDLLGSSIYPNPANNQIAIMTEESGRLRYSLINTIGAIVQTGDVQIKNQVDVNTSLIANGIYFLQLELNGKKSVHKVSILR